MHTELPFRMKSGNDFGVYKGLSGNICTLLPRIRVHAPTYVAADFCELKIVAIYLD